MKDNPQDRHCALQGAPLVIAVALVVVPALAMAPPAHPAGKTAPSSRSTGRAIATASAQPETLTATVRSVDTGAGNLDLLTGVGHALRIRRVHLEPEAKILAGRRATPASALAPGSIVRVVFRQATAGTAASSVELLRAPARGGKP